jgi:hypothetical protein
VVELAASLKTLAAAARSEALEFVHDTRYALLIFMCWASKICKCSNFNTIGTCNIRRKRREVKIKRLRVGCASVCYQRTLDKIVDASMREAKTVVGGEHGRGGCFIS